MSIDGLYTPKLVYDALLSTFHQYLRAQYHIWDESLIRERDRLFAQVGITHQEPFVEATPVYKNDASYSALAIPQCARDILELASSVLPSTGIPKKPYIHQAEAISAFLGEHQDIIAATGTGSGKTETFLMPILGSLAIESASRPESWCVPGTRSLLLYPMNALVNDQMSRLRKLLGNVDIQAKLRGGRSRNVTFGMYTSRTPYAGRQTKAKDKKRIHDALEKMYFNGMSEDVRNLLNREGKWPAKDLSAFLESGLITSPGDSELVTRHEMQRLAPDILVTNYSMLEYMMLRPIEASIFEQTKIWLARDVRNVFTVVLDEAHMYRGSAGAEVAYLLRRLHARLGVTRDRVRYILTSASLGSGDELNADALDFARKLTGGEGAQGYRLVSGVLAERQKGEIADQKSLSALVAFDLQALQSVQQKPEALYLELRKLALGLGQEIANEFSTFDNLRVYAYRLLERLPVAHRVASQATSSPTSLSVLARHAFGDRKGALAALDTLLSIMAFAKDPALDRSFASIRSHIFFRGLQGLYACSNRHCKEALGNSESRVLGALYSRGAFQCSCGSRVYELLTHRDCGAAYLRGYVTGAEGNFLWHEPSARTWSDRGLIEIHVYVLRYEDAAQFSGYVKWLHTPTGRLLDESPEFNTQDFLPLAWGTRTIQERGKSVITLEPECPACKRDLGLDPKIMDLATKGEAPFAHLIKTQVAMQPSFIAATHQSPNGGRKSLLFSDGRQKAARLARDIPREIELDVFRQLLFMAAKHLVLSGLEPVLDSRIYLGFLAALKDHSVALFDGADRRSITAHADEFSNYYSGDFSEARSAYEPPSAFTVSLLRQLCSSFYSVGALALGVVVPTKLASKRLSDLLGVTDEADIMRLCVPWIARLLSKYAFDVSIASGVRRRAWQFRVFGLSARDGFTERQRQHLAAAGYNVDKVVSAFADILCDPVKDDGIFLSPNKLKLETSYSKDWVQCSGCKGVLPVDWWGVCANCLQPAITRVIPAESTYLRARKGFWHDPVVAAVERNQRPVNLAVEEHTAQLSHKDADRISTTTEDFERRFRDILVTPRDESVDVLSSTTTMEVGIDIGSLIAVGLRNVPPMRQNYQQRAGRAGRRGTTVSSVVTYAQSGPHDSHYFLNPHRIIEGNPPRPILDVNNVQIVKRHVRAQLVQDFFGPRVEASSSGDLRTVLGSTADFYQGTSRVALTEFKAWLSESEEAKISFDRASKWIPVAMSVSVESMAKDFVDRLEGARPSLGQQIEEGLLDFMFTKGLLPSYAFPRDLCALAIERQRPGKKYPHIEAVERPQQGLAIALSEYAPGKLLVVNKKTYRVGTVTANSSFTDANRARPLFESARKYVHCELCLYTSGFASRDEDNSRCPQCGNDSIKTVTVITPEVVYPQGGGEVNEYDDEYTFSRASEAQLPLTDANAPLLSVATGKRGSRVFQRAQDLVVVNRGAGEAGSGEGFEVCTDCGKVLLDGEVPGAHERDYLVQNSRGASRGRCSGRFEHVYLGYKFISDALILRFDVVSPLRFDLTDKRMRRPLQDALITLADALVLAMSRVLDIDVREVNAGHRFAVIGDRVCGDIFVYDTLSGGAGYAFEAGKRFDEIFDATLTLLKGCVCDRSCEECLRHYGNRFNHEVLDRHLALEVANYIKYGVIPPPLDHEQAAKAVEPLARLLELAGWSIDRQTRGYLRATLASKDVRVVVSPSLLIPDAPHDDSGAKLYLTTPYEMTRDLATVYSEVV